MKHQFKPFDQVLVRDHDTHQWRVNLFSHYMPKQIGNAYVCIGGTFNQCIPYNEETAHLIGTNKPYQEPEPKVWQVSSVGYNNMMTNEELQNFIKNAVVNNKDITDFRIRYIEQ